MAPLRLLIAMKVAPLRPFAFNRERRERVPARDFHRSRLRARSSRERIAGATFARAEPDLRPRLGSTPGIATLA
jgi:hypothetical protein